MWAGGLEGREGGIFRKSEPCSLDDYCVRPRLYNYRQGPQRRQVRQRRALEISHRHVGYRIGSDVRHSRPDLRKSRAMDTRLFALSRILVGVSRWFHPSHIASKMAKWNSAALQVCVAWSRKVVWNHSTSRTVEGRGWNFWDVSFQVN